MAGRALDRVTVLGMSAFGGGETGARAIVCEYKITLSELEHSSRAREQNFWTTRRRARPVVKLVREIPSPPYGLSLIGMLPDLAMWCRYGDLVSRVTILTPCDTMLVPVPSAAPRRGG